MMNATTPATNDDMTSEKSMNNLYTAIIQCFVIILSGYLAGRFNLISSPNAKGLSVYISHFALPALLFRSMVRLDLNNVNWMFLLSILISKSSIFILVAVATLILIRPTNLGKAGLYGIFATQSNDFALGYPIIQAVYTESHPEFLSYIYLVVPISIAVLNPIGFIMMEIQNRRDSPVRRGGTLRLVWNVAQGVLTNPVVFMTLLGLVMSFVLSHHIPQVLDGFLKVLADSFSATALFYLGLSMVGKIRNIAGTTLLQATLLIGCKALLLPFITREVINGLDAGGSDNETVSLAEFGFLYGTFPTAPTVFVFASQFGISQDLIGTGMVACTFLSAPLMFVSAKMVSLTVSDQDDYHELVTSTSFDMSILGLVCSIWVIAVLVFSRRWKSMPHQYTICLLLAQFLACLGMIVNKNTTETTWRHYVQFIIFLIGVLSSRIWTALLAVAVAVYRTKGANFVYRLRIPFIIIGFGIPALLTGTLLIASPNHKPDEIDPSFHYGSHQLILSSTVLLLSLLVTLFSLVVYQRGHVTRTSDYQRISDDDDGATSALLDDQNYAPGRHVAVSETLRRLQAESVEDCSTNSTGLRAGAGDTTRHISRPTEESEQTSGDELEGRVRLLRSVGDPQLTRHVVVLLFLTLSMIIGLFLCMWRLFHESTSGIYIEIEFLDSVFNFGQSFFLFCVFGVDVQFVILPFIKRWRKFVYDTELVHLPRESELDAEVRHTAESFKRHHLNLCKAEIAADRRFGLRTYKQVFTGRMLCDWLIEYDLATDRQLAVAYGKKLLLARLIRHVTEEHHFHDLDYFYRFNDASALSSTDSTAANGASSNNK